MSKIAGIQDFRQHGPPADVGLFQFPATAIVFKFTFSGTTYTVAMAVGVGGWSLIAQSPSGADNVEIQAANDYVYSLGGGKVVLLRGDFSTDAAVDVNSQVDVAGMGPGTKVEATGNFAVFRLVGIVSDLLFRVTIGYMRIHGSGMANTSSYGVFSEFSSRCTLENLTFERCYAAVYVHGAYSLTLQNILIAGTGAQQNAYGILTAWNGDQINELTADNMMIGDVDKNGVRLKGASGCLWTNVMIINADEDAWYVGDEGAGEFSEYNHFVNCHGDSPNHAPYAAWFFKKGSADFLRGIQMANCWAGGYRYGMIFDGADEVWISNPYCRDLEYHAIDMIGCDFGSITGGGIVEFDRGDSGTYDGIRLYNTTDITVNGVPIKTSTTHQWGINESGTSDYNIIQNCNLRGTNGLNRSGNNSIVGHETERLLCRGAGSAITGNAAVAYANLSASVSDFEAPDVQQVFKATAHFIWDPITVSGGVKIRNDTDGADVALSFPGAAGWRYDKIDCTATIQGLAAAGKRFVVKTRGDGADPPTLEAVFLRLVLTTNLLY